MSPQETSRYPLLLLVPSQIQECTSQSPRKGGYQLDGCHPSTAVHNQAIVECPHPSQMTTKCMLFCDFQPFLPSWPIWRFQSWKMCLRNILFNYKYSDLICWYLKSRCSYIEKLGLRKQLIKINSLSNAPAPADKQEKSPNTHSYCQSWTWEVPETEQRQPQTLLSIGKLLPQQQGQCREELLSSCRLQGWEDEQIPPADLQHCIMAISPWTSSHSHCSQLAGWHFATLHLLFFSCVHLCCDSQRGFSQPPAVPTLPLSPYGPGELLQPGQGCKMPEDLRISAKTVEYPTIQCSFLAICSTVFTRFHHSVTNSNELKVSTGWKRTTHL